MQVLRLGINCAQAMYIHSSPGWGLLGSGISAASGLLGVAVGGWITARHQRIERRKKHLSDQLQLFYAPLIGILLEIRAKSEVRVKLSTTARDSWSSLFENVQSPHIKERIQKDKEPEFTKLFDYNNRQLTEDIVPLYRKMLAIFNDQIGFAEESTLNHFRALVEFVEIWNRFLKGTLPMEVLDKIEHKEETLSDLYTDLKTQFDRLHKELKEE